jgi:hypothetical protein
MSTSAPVVSIVVPDLGRSLDGVLESLHGQRDDRLEVVVEKGADFGTAVERGCARSRGAILGWLDADDRLVPGALPRIAAAIAPERGVCVAMGRAAWRVDGVDEVLVPHPSEYLGIDDHLRIWEKGFDTVPRASFFWHRSVRERVGPFMPGPAHAVAYDFVCRVGKRFAVNVLDDLWSLSCLPGEAAADRTEREMLQDCIAISRRHWGPWWSPSRWTRALSLARYERNWHEHARHYARRRERALADGRRLDAALELARTWLYSPSMARGRFLDR